MSSIRSSIFFYLLMGASAVGLIATSKWLSSHATFRASPPYLNQPRQTTSHGEAVSFDGRMQVVDALSDETLWYGPAMPGACLVDEHFMVCPQDDQTVVYDFDDYRKFPLQRRGNANWRDVALKPIASVDRNSLGIATARKIPKIFLQPSLVAIPGTNRFIAQYKEVDTGGGDHAFACEVESKRIRLLSHWKFESQMLFIGANGDVFSVRPDSREVEVRSSRDFEVRRTMPLPPELWRRWIFVRNGLISHAPLPAQTVQVYELETLSLVPSLDLPVFIHGQQEIGADRRYSMLSDRDVHKWRRLVVYDTREHKTVYDSGSPKELTGAKIIDGRLRIETAFLGKTRTWIDLQSGNQLNVEYVGAWLIIASVFAVLATMAWCACWIKFGPRSKRWVSGNIVFVGVLLLCPMLGIEHRYLIRVFMDSLTLDYVFAITLALSFSLILYGVCSTGRRLLKSIPILAFLIGLFLLIQQTKSVVIDPLHPEVASSLGWRIWLSFTFLTTSGLAVLRAIGLRLTTQEQLQNSRQTLFKTEIHLADVIVFILFLAGLVVLLIPYYDLVIVADRYRASVVMQSACLAMAASFGLLSLIHYRNSQRYAIGFAIGLGIFIALGIMTVVALRPYAYQGWYHVARAMHRPLIVAMSAFVFCSLLRRAGLTLIYLGQDREQNNELVVPSARENATIGTEINGA